MAVHFSRERMEQVIDNHTRWWKGELGRPLVNIMIPDAHPYEKKTPAPILSQQNCNDFSWSPEQVIDALDEDLSRFEYVGDGYPLINFDSFGPGSLAAFCGAKLDNSSGRIWFWPSEEQEIADIHVKYDPENIYAKRIKDIYRAGLEKWNGTVMMGLPDLGGVLDVAASLRGTENLLMDLYDEPDEVKRLTAEIQTAWYEAYEDFSNVLKPQGANANWTRLLCKEPSYVTQCDFSYMIGNDMFKEFVLDTLIEDTRRLPYTIYHMDGIGELNHFDDLLAIPTLTAIQWQMGEGKPSPKHWPDVYRKILASGKQMQIVRGAQDFLDVIEQVHGTPYAYSMISIKDQGLISRVLNAR